MGIIPRIGKRKRPDGRPRITYGYRFWWHGQLQKQMLGENRSLAVEAEKRERRRLERDFFEAQWGPVKRALTPWKEAIERWTKAKANKKTLDWDITHLEWWGTCFAEQGIHYLQAVSPDAIDVGQRKLEAAGMEPNTIRNYLAVLRGLFRLAIKRWKLVREDPTSLVDWPPKEEKDLPVPTVEQVMAIYDKADVYIQRLIIGALHTGQRKDIVLRLTKERFLERPGEVHVRTNKGGKLIWLPVTPTLQAMIDGLGVESGRLFRTPEGQPWAGFPEDRWRTARAAAGLPWVRFHDIRHCTGTALSEAGVPQRVIQEWLVHSTGKMTERYTRPTRQGMQGARDSLERVTQAAKRTADRIDDVEKT